MGSVHLDCSDIRPEEGSSNKQLVSLHVSNGIDNPLVKSQSEDGNRVEASHVLKVSEEYQVTKAQLLSSCGLIKEATPEESGPCDFPDASDIEEEVELPRVGAKYQAEVPTLLSDSEQNLSTIPYQYIVGLTIPVIWVQLKESDTEDGRNVCIDHDDAKRPNESRKKKKRQLGHNKRGSELNISVLDVQSDPRKDSKLAKPGVKVEVKAQMHKTNISKSHFLVPDIQYGAWNDADVNSFLLGLYIFGKNFVQIKRFVEKKEMADVLSFYYAKFCRSNMHRRWSDCIKRRNKKRVWGSKLFSGWRQQELLSRLLSHVKEENRNKLLEVSKLFTKEVISLEEYVFSLKDIVGLHNLSKAVGISGKGKDDLSGISMAPVCPKIPTGKACSSLTSSNIIKCLTGRFRLSREQLSDIFWEAVWPRLIARGWQAEQLKNRRFNGSSNCFIFLKPGMKAFARKNLLKDEDFFDSPSDVLRKVASEPHLLEAEETRNDDLKEVRDSPVLNSLADNVLDHQDHSSHNPQDNIWEEMFTIVDTSSTHKGKAYKLRKLSETLVYSETNSRLTCPKEVDKGNSLDKSLDAYGMDIAEEQLDCEKNVHSARQCKDASDRDVSTNMQFTVVDTSSAHGEKSSSFRGIKFVLKGLSSEPTSSELTIALSCKDSVVEQLKGGYNVPSDGNMHVDDFSGEGLSDSGALDIYNATTSMGGRMEENRTMPDDKQSKRTIKLHVKRRAECASTLFKEIQDIENESERLNSMQLEPYSPSALPGQGKEPSTNSCTEALKPDTAASNTKHQPNAVTKRQSTRSRPLTAKANEALESGEIYNVWKRKTSAETKNDEETFLDNSCRAPEV